MTMKAKLAPPTHLKTLPPPITNNSPREEEEEEEEEEERSIMESSTPKRTSTKKKKKSNNKSPTPHKEPWPKRKGSSGVTLEGYLVEGSSNDDHGSENGVLVGRTKSLTDEDLDELKGCLDLGFGFSYDEIPELCNTLPALELCYSMSQSFLDDHHKSPTELASLAPIANWKFSSPGDDPEEVKARLKYWAQAVACTVKLCS